MRAVSRAQKEMLLMLLRLVDLYIELLTARVLQEQFSYTRKKKWVFFFFMSVCVFNELIN